MIFALLSSLICASAVLALMLRDIRRDGESAARAERANAFEKAVRGVRHARKTTGHLKPSVAYTEPHPHLDLPATGSAPAGMVLPAPDDAT